MASKFLKNVILSDMPCIWRGVQPSLNKPRLHAALRGSRGFVSTYPFRGIQNSRFLTIPPAAVEFEMYNQFSSKPEKQEKGDEMFCYQCEQTKARKGCNTHGICGKTPEVSALQDLLVHALKGLAIYGHAAVKEGAEVSSDVYDFVHGALFSTLTNVNFDAARFPVYIAEALEMRQMLKELYEEECTKKGKTPLPFDYKECLWQPSPGMMDDVDALREEGKNVGVLSELSDYGDNVNGVRQMIIYGLKGMSTYARHARFLGKWDDSIGQFTLEVISFLCVGPEHERKDLTSTLEWALKVGEFNLKGMALLNDGHKQRFGIPQPTQVSTKPKVGKCILVSGHDMNDLEEILKVTEGTDINVYTHGELLPAHGYPHLRGYKSLAGHYGGAWQLQKYEFPGFPGPIVVTTNCLVEPMKSYKERLFTLSETGWPGCTHLSLPRDLDVIIKAANESGGYSPDAVDNYKEETVYTVGFGHDAILGQAGKILEAVDSGDLERVFVIGGCDGAEHKRNYFTNLADSLPNSTLILTMGCAKYRFNKHDFGYLGKSGIPRLLDMGQCNDAYGAVMVAQALAEALKTDINSLPLSICLSWFEQKAIAVLLSMLHLGVQNIRVGPILPAFLTPDVVGVLMDKFSIQPVDIRHPTDDMRIMMGK